MCSRVLMIMELLYAGYWELQSWSMSHVSLVYFVSICKRLVLNFCHPFSFPSIMDFFKEFPQFVVKAGSILSHLYGMDWENRIEVMLYSNLCLYFGRDALSGVFYFVFYICCQSIWDFTHAFAFIFIRQRNYRSILRTWAV